MLSQLASRVVNGAREACGVHDEFTKEVASLHIVLGALEQEVAKPNSILNSNDDEKMKELAALVEPCQKVLRMMEKILDKYNAMNEEKRSITKLWKKTKFGGEMQDLEKIRRDLATHTVTITMFLNLQTVGSLGKVELHMKGHKGDMMGLQQSVNWIIGSLQASNKHGEGSILTSYASDDKLFWKELRRSLVKEGYPSHKLEKHKTKIHEYVRALGDHGLLDDLIAEDISTIVETKLTTLDKPASCQLSKDLEHIDPVVVSSSSLQKRKGPAVSKAGEDQNLTTDNAAIRKQPLSTSDTTGHSSDRLTTKSSPGRNQTEMEFENKPDSFLTDIFSSEHNTKTSSYHMRWCRVAIGEEERLDMYCGEEFNTHGRADRLLSICPELQEELSTQSDSSTTNSSHSSLCKSQSALGGARLKRSGKIRGIHRHWPHERTAAYVRTSESGNGKCPTGARFAKACPATKATYDIPPGHNVYRWDPTFRFLVVRSNVFDHCYFGKWVYDWNIELNGIHSHITLDWLQIWNILSQIVSCVHYWDSIISEVHRFMFTMLLHKWFDDAFSLLEDFNRAVEASEKATIQAYNTKKWDTDEIEWFVAHLTAARLSKKSPMANWYTKARAWSWNFDSNWKEIFPRGKDIQAAD